MANIYAINNGYIDAGNVYNFKTKQTVDGIRSNPNLLKNWYFVNPVNSLGKTSYTNENNPCIDKWHTIRSSDASNCGIDLTSTGITITNSLPTGGIYVLQTIDGYLSSIPDGTQVTLSLLTADGQLYNGTGSVSSSQALSLTYSWGVLELDTGKEFAIIVTANQTITFAAAKVEIGDQQTLAHYNSSTSKWELNEIPYKEELITEIKTKYQCNPNLFCNWYFVGVGGLGNFPVNTSLKHQSGGDGYAQPAIDNWICQWSTIWEMSNDGGGTYLKGNWGTRQILPHYLPPGTYTFTMLYEDFYDPDMRFLISALKIDTTQIFGAVDIIPSNGLYTKTFTIQDTAAIFELGFSNPDGSNPSRIKLKAMKLEVGDKQTLCHIENNGSWVLNDYPKYANMVKECIREDAISFDRYLGGSTITMPGSGRYIQYNLHIYVNLQDGHQSLTLTAGSSLNWTSNLTPGTWASSSMVLTLTNQHLYEISICINYLNSNAEVIIKDWSS